VNFISVYFVLFASCVMCDVMQDSSIEHEINLV